MRDEIRRRVKEHFEESLLYKNLDEGNRERFRRGLAAIVGRFVRSGRHRDMGQGFNMMLDDTDESLMFALLERVGKPHSAVKGVKRIVSGVLSGLLHPDAFPDARTQGRIRERSLKTGELEPGSQRRTNEVAPPSQRHNMPRRNR